MISFSFKSTGKHLSFVTHLDISFSFFFFLRGAGDTPGGAQDLFLPRHSGSLLLGIWVPGIKPGLAACKANALPIVLWLQLQNLDFLTLT